MKHVQGELEEPESNSLFLDSDTNYLSDKSHGCRILSKCKWLELTESERSKNDVQNVIIRHMYNGNVIDVDQLKIYNLYPSGNF